MELYKDLIIDGAEYNTKLEVFELIANSIVAKFDNLDKEEIINGLVAREEISSTGFENGIAIPHTKVDGLKAPQIIVVRNTNITWPSVDGTPTELVVSILVPSDAQNLHLGVLSNLARNFVNADFTNALKNGTLDEAYETLAGAFETKKTEATNIDNAINIVAVTACTTGIAHTFMAAENLEKAALKDGYNIKIETRSQGGAGNELTAEDIKNADYVLICCDVAVPMSRFSGKKLLKNKVKIAVDDPSSLFKDMLDALFMFLMIKRVMKRVRLQFISL